MKRVITVTAFALAVTAIVATAPSVPGLLASDCRRISVDLTPLTELPPERYQGHVGGLYHTGQNTPPADHLAVAKRRIDDIMPLAPDGSPSSTGRIVLLSLGIDMATMEYQAFMDLADGDPQINPAVLLVDGAQGGRQAEGVTSADSEYWNRVDARLADAGGTSEQVQAIWLKYAERQPRGPFPEHAEALRDELQTIVEIAHNRFPNLQIVYLSSRIYAGYATSRLNPEPYAYESAFAVRWLIEKQASGDRELNADPRAGEVRAPALMWGPYMWADGLTTRGDGLEWHCSDFEDDGTRPSATGRQKVANMLMAFFKTDETAKPWFMVDEQATPIASATSLPTNTTAPTRTPGGGRRTRVPPTSEPTTPGPSPTPAPMNNYRVQEVPTGDQMWVSTDNPAVQRQLENIDPSAETWVCGRIERVEALEWGFRFDPRSVAVTGEAPRQIRSTIREISTRPPTGIMAYRCIRVGQVVQTIEGTPTPWATQDPRTPTATSRWPFPTRTPGATRPTETLRLYLPILQRGY